MKTVNEYSSETVNMLKRWLSSMAEHGNTKYYEILVDGIRVVHKTSRLEEYDQHIKWMDETVQSMRVLVYNTKNSHRSMPFEFRTDKYVEGLSNKLYPTRKKRLNEDEVNRRVQQTVVQRQKEQDFADLQKQNQILTKRIGDAEDYIRKLEAKVEDKKDDKEDFNFGSMLKMASVMAEKNPALKKQLEDFGLTGLVNEQETKTSSQDAEEPTATFRRKTSPVENDQSHASSDYKNESKDDTLTLKVPIGNLNDDQCAKMFDLAYFLAQNPQYINTVHGLLKDEELKQAG